MPPESSATSSWCIHPRATPTTGFSTGYVVIIRGRVAIVADPDEQARVDAAYRAKYVDPHSGARASIHDNPADDLYRVVIERVIAWSYGTVGTWTEWRLAQA